LFPEKHTVYIFFLCFLALSWKLYGTPYFLPSLTAAIITFINYSLRFRWKELLPGTLAVVAVLGISSLFSPKAELPPKVAWIKELHGQKVAITADWKFIRLKSEEVRVGDLIDEEGKLLVKNNSVGARLQRVRFNLYRKLEETVDYPLSALIGACTLGIRYELPASTKGYFALSGLYHFLAISGLHVGVVIGALAALFRLLGLRRPLTTASLAVLPLMPLTGLPPSAVRAYLFALLLSLGIESFRKISPLYTLGVVMLLTILFGEFNLSAALSFSAVGGILLAAQGEGSSAEKWLKVAVAPMLFTLPIVLNVFGTVNAASWLSTLLTGFIFTPFLVASFGAQVLLFKLPLLNQAAQWLGALFVQSVQWAFDVTKWAIIHSEISVAIAATTFLGALVLALWGGVRLVLLPPALLLIFAAFNQTVVKGRELHLHGWRLNSFRFVATEGQRYRECTIYGTYVMPATRKLLFWNTLVDERLKYLKGKKHYW